MKVLALAVVVAAAILVSGCASRRTVAAAPAQPAFAPAGPVAPPAPVRSYQLDK